MINMEIWVENLSKWQLCSRADDGAPEELRVAAAAHQPHMHLCIDHHVISEGQAVNPNTKLELKGALYIYLPVLLLIDE